MNLLFLAITLSEVPVRTLRTLSTVRLRASLLPRNSLKIAKSTVVDSLFGRIASLKAAVAPSPYFKYGSVRYSLSPRTPSQLTSSRRSLRGGQGFFGFGSVMLRGMQ